MHKVELSWRRDSMWISICEKNIDGITWTLVSRATSDAFGYLKNLHRSEEHGIGLQSDCPPLQLLQGVEKTWTGTAAVQSFAGC